jgi:hypothetical protein
MAGKLVWFSGYHFGDGLAARGRRILPRCLGDQARPGSEIRLPSFLADDTLPVPRVGAIRHRYVRVATVMHVQTMVVMRIEN